MQIVCERARAAAAAGFEIIYPEEMPIGTLVGKLVAADLIVVSEGSAIHNIELCGRIDGRIYMIGRRLGTKNFHALLDTLCRDWSIHRPGNQLFSLDWESRTNRQSSSRICTFLDIPELIEDLAKFSGRTLAMPDIETIRRETALDLVTYLMQPGAGRGASDEQLGASLRTLRGFPGLQRLLEVASP